jgi:hypothetical protein
MKKVLLTVTLMFFAFAFPLGASADIIGTATLKLSYSDPTSWAYIVDGSGTYYLDYDASLNGGAWSQAFCVEDASGPTASTATTYTLLSIDVTLASFGLNAEDYYAAAWVAEYWYTHYKSASEDYVAAAQILIWEYIFDDTFNLYSGYFYIKNTNAYLDEINEILAAIPDSFSASSTWVLAVNPTVDEGDAVTTKAYQNYLVRVPEPFTVLLLGLGLLGISGISRRMKKL